MTIKKKNPLEGEENEHRRKMSEAGEPMSIGHGGFGEIYDWAGRDQREAFDFLIGNESGDLLNVFYRDDIGGIDLVWGDENSGLCHIIDKHVGYSEDGKKRDFGDVEEMKDALIRILGKGSLLQERDNKRIYTLDGFRVVVSKDNEGENKNWVITAVDYNRSTKEKGIATNPTIASHSAKGAELDASRNSKGKGSENFGNSKENGENLRFREDDEEPKTLVGVHNISEEKLRRAIRLGGLANPSMAIINPEKQGFTGYGDITFLMSPQMVDAKTGKNIGTFLHDARTPMVPSLVLRPSEAGWKRYNRDLDSVPKEMRGETSSGLHAFLNEGRIDGRGLEYLFLQEKGVAPEIEGTSSRVMRKCEDYIKENDLGGEFSKWVDSLEDRYEAKGYIPNGYTSIGNRRYIRATLDAISKWMKKRGRAGAVKDFTGVMSLTDKFVPRVKSVKDIKKNERRLATDEELKEAGEHITELGNAIFEAGSSIQRDGDGMFEPQEMVIDALEHSGNPREYLKRVYGRDLSEEQANKLRGLLDYAINELRAPYFETKFERGVKFDEFSGVIVPDNVDKDILDYFDKVGTPVYTYKHGDDADRSRVLREVARQEDVMFREEDEGTRPRGPLRPGETIFDRAEAIGGKSFEEQYAARQRVREAAMGREERELKQSETMRRRVDVVLEKLKNITAEHKQDEALTREAVSKLNGELLSIRKGMTMQKNYEINTVKRVRHLANEMLATGLLEPQGRSEVENLMRILNNAIEGATTGTGRRFKKSVDDLMDMMVKSQLRKSEAELKKQLGVKGFTTKGADGKMGPRQAKGFDDRGITMLNTMRQALKMNYNLDDIQEAKYEYLEQSATDPLAMAKYEAMCLMEDWQTKIQDLQKDEKRMAEELEEVRKSGQLSKKDMQEYEDAVKQAIRETRMERAKNITDLVAQLSAKLQESAEKAREKREKDEAHVKELYEDMFGDNTKGGVELSSEEMAEETRMQKVVNNPIVQFFTSSLPSFDSLLRMYGRNHVSGRGRLWHRFMKQGYEASDEAFLTEKRQMKELNSKVAELWGRKGMRLTDLYGATRDKLSTKISYLDGSKEKERNLTVGNALYIYMVDKMTDGVVKLRKMGIDAEKVARLKEEIEDVDPRLIALVDWIQEDFLPKVRKEYNKTHVEMFGTSMDDIENYVPLRINKNSIREQVDLGEIDGSDKLPSSLTGSIIQRTRNSLPVDIFKTDGLEVIADHVREMSKWSAYAPMIKDLCTMLSSKKFRMQTMNMTTPYGSGRKLWKRVKQAAALSVNAYNPAAKNSGDDLVVNLGKAAATGAIALRFYTAYKQLASMPAFCTTAGTKSLLHAFVNPMGSWRWAMENLPSFEKRWKSRIAGETRLMQTENDWSWFRKKWVESASKAGLFANAAIDAITVACGARATYDTSLRNYLSEGYSQEAAEEKARFDATTSFNETQQSTEGLNVVPLQMDRTWWSWTLSLFKNAPFAYGRKVMESVYGMGRLCQDGFKERSIAEITRQKIKDGVDEDHAKAAAEKEYARERFRTLYNFFTFGFSLPAWWYVFSQFPTIIARLITGGGDEEDDNVVVDLMKNVAVRGASGYAEGLPLGKELGEFLTDENTYRDNFLPSSPYVQRLTDIGRDIKSSDYGGAVNEIASLAMMEATGVDPNTLSTMAMGVYDACDGNIKTTRDVFQLINAINNVPKSQRDKIFFDQLDMSAKDAVRLTPKEVAEKYMDTRAKRRAGLSWLVRTEKGYDVGPVHVEGKQELREKQKATTSERLNKKLAAIGGREINKELESIEPEFSQLRKMYNNSELRFKPRVAQAFHRVERIRRELNKAANDWKTADTAAKVKSATDRIVDYKKKYVKEWEQVRKQVKFDEKK